MHSNDETARGMVRSIGIIVFVFWDGACGWSVICDGFINVVGLIGGLVLGTVSFAWV